LADESVVIHGITHSKIEETPHRSSTFLEPLLAAITGHVLVVALPSNSETFFWVNALLTRAH